MKSRRKILVRRSRDGLDVSVDSKGTFTTQQKRTPKVLKEKQKVVKLILHKLTLRETRMDEPHETEGPTHLIMKSILKPSEDGNKEVYKKVEKERGENEQGHSYTSTRTTIECKESSRQINKSERKETRSRMC